jgi:hypothetical protein
MLWITWRVPVYNVVDDVDDVDDVESSGTMWRMTQRGAYNMYVPVVRARAGKLTPEFTSYEGYIVE